MKFLTIAKECLHEAYNYFHKQAFYQLISSLMQMKKHRYTDFDLLWQPICWTCLLLEITNILYCCTSISPSFIQLAFIIGLTFNLQLLGGRLFLHTTDSVSVCNIFDIYIHIAYKKKYCILCGKLSKEFTITLQNNIF